MIKVLGTKVVVMIVLLVLVNAGAGYGLYEYLIPMREQKNSELAGLKAEVEARRLEVARLKEEFVLLQRQLRDFKELEAQGFFNNQNRVKAQESFNELRQLAGLLKTKYEISSGLLNEDPNATAANHVVLRSPVKLEIDSMDDVDVYTFVKALLEKFPGSVDITGFKLDRDENVTAPLLRQIGSGTPVKLVTSQVEFDWRTMAGKDRLDEFDTSTTVGSQADEPVQAGQAAPGAVAPQAQPAPQPVQPTVVQ